MSFRIGDQQMTGQSPFASQPTVKMETTTTKNAIPT